ncbi:MAG: DUF2997 domain-containing protein [Lacipirellulaceae bacterium]
MKRLCGNTTIKHIEITISPTGETKLQTLGFHGSSCQEASRQFEQALGVVTQQRLTEEYYAVQSQQQASQTAGQSSGEV